MTHSARLAAASEWPSSGCCAGAGHWPSASTKAGYSPACCRNRKRPTSNFMSLPSPPIWPAARCMTFPALRSRCASCGRRAPDPSRLFRPIRSRRRRSTPITLQPKPTGAAPPRRLLSPDGLPQRRRCPAYVAEEILPGSKCCGDADLLAFTRKHGATIFHPAGSCRMGSDDDAVVDPRLRVRGVDALWVADCSIMPRLISGNTNIPTIMIGEKAADMICADNPN